MKRLVFLLFFAFIFLSLNAKVEVSGHITSNAIWSAANSPYIIIGDVYIDTGVTLTIEAGTIIKFEYVAPTSKPHSNRKFIVNGKLNAQGTAENNVVFTSLRDDSSGGDDNMDGSATIPAAGDWGYIQINSNNNNLQYCTFRYGGLGGYSNYSPYYHDKYMVWIKNSVTPAISISNCKFDYAYETAIYYDDILYNGTPTINNNQITNSPYGIYLKGNETSSATIFGNTISGSATDGIYCTSVRTADILNNKLTNCNTHGIYIKDGTVNIAGNIVNLCRTGISTDNAIATIANNSITNSTSYPLKQLNNAFPAYTGNTITGSGQTAIAVGGTISENGTWSNVEGLGLAYAVIGDITISSEATLTIPAGTIIKFEYVAPTNKPHSNRKFIVNGKLNAQGTAENNVVFTSLRDDSSGPLSENDQFGLISRLLSVATMQRYQYADFVFSLGFQP